MDGDNYSSMRQQIDRCWGRLAELSKVIASNETRLSVLFEVAAGVGHVTVIAEHLGVAPYDVSKHMAKLFRCRLVQPNPEEPSAYELAPDVEARADETGLEIVVLAGGIRVRLAAMDE